MSDPKYLESVAKDDFEGLSDVLFLNLKASDRERDRSSIADNKVVQNNEKVSVQFDRNIVTTAIERLCEAISRDNVIRQGGISSLINALGSVVGLEGCKVKNTLQFFPRGGEQPRPCDDSRRDFGCSVIELWIISNPREASTMIGEHPTWIKEYFKDAPSIAVRDHRIAAWFDHFSTKGSSHFRNGSYSLAIYALRERNICWKSLCWKGGHGQSPAIVASKTEYFMHLDLVETISEFAKHQSDFWNSQEFLDQIRGSDLFTSTDPQYWAHRLFEQLETVPTADLQESNLWNVLTAYISKRDSWREICNRAATRLQESDLLLFSNTLLQECAGEQTSSSTLPLRLRHLVATTFEDLNTLIACVWLSWGQRSLYRDFKTLVLSLEKDILQYHIHMSAPEFWALIRNSDNQFFSTLLSLHSFTAYYYLKRKDEHSPEELAALLTVSGIPCRCKAKKRVRDDPLLFDDTTSHQQQNDIDSDARASALSRNVVFYAKVHDGTAKVKLSSSLELIEMAIDEVMRKAIEIAGHF